MALNDDKQPVREATDEQVGVGDSDGPPKGDDRAADSDAEAPEAAAGHAATGNVEPASPADGTPPVATSRGRAVTGTVPPLGLSVIFLAGLVVLYAGQRLILTWEGVASFATWAGVALMVAGTAGRFSPLFRGRDARADVARILDGLQLLGLLGVALFGLTTATGSSLLGLDGENAEHVLTVLEVCWIIALAVSITGLVFAEIALHPMRDASHLESGRVRAAAISGATLALAASYGSLFVYAAAQQEAQADFSYFKTSEPGEATIKLLQRASGKVKVTAFFPNVNQVRKEVEGYLTKLAKASDNVEVRVVDRYLEPALAKELKAVSDGTVVISMDDASKSLKVGTKIERARKTLMKFDGEFYEQLVKLITSRRTVYWTTGHGELNDQDRGAENPERSAKVAKELLERQNLRVRELGLSQGLAKEVPDDADVVLVLGPTQPFAPEEIAALKRYAAGGGKVLMALDADGISMRDTVNLGHTAEPGQAAGAEHAAEGPANGSDGAAGAEASKKSRVAADGTADERTADEKKATEQGQTASDEAKEDEESAAVPEGLRWLTDLSEAVGARFVPTVLADPAQHVVRRNDPSDRIIMPTNRFSSHASVSTLSRNSSRAAVVVMGAGYLKGSDAGMGKPSVTLRTLPSAFDDQNRDYQMNDGEKRNTFSLAVALTHKPENAVPAASDDSRGQGSDEAATGGGPSVQAKSDAHGSDEDAHGSDEAERDTKIPKEMRAFVIADADVLSDVLMERVVGNQMLLIDAIRWLVGEESLAGEMESEEDVRIEHTKQEDIAWFYSTIFGIPALVLSAGVWTSRRLRRGSRRGKSKPPTRGANA